ncbi:HMGL-like-domain-containing protein [Stachybotrys elegans]|uniref:HMGL-like-domain-containing protein n=1 Tax=Stachybotrys elegans TaxID=80388 RepID=A0A8K0WYB2_9HYPO|nr:HMGL-like-domain-containing protein [Stachybotrys elegans]
MAPPITHHTSHTMGNGASSSNSGCHGNASSLITHHTSHTMENGASSGAGGGGQSAPSQVVEAALTTSTEQQQTLNNNDNNNTTHTGFDDLIEHSQAQDGDSAELSSSVGSISPCDTDESDDDAAGSPMTTNQNSVILENWSIIDSTLREGEQFANAYFTTEQKMQIARALDDIGVEYIELTSPVASVQSFEDCAAICKMGLKTKVLCHIRCNLDDAKRAVEAGVDGINMCIGTSAQLMEHSHGKDMAYIAATAKKVIEYVKANNIEIRFSGEDSFRSDFSEILKLYSLMDSLGANRVGIADTVGGASPMEVYNKISALRKTVSCDIETHFHNDTGCAISNALLALEAGATHIDTTVLGIGERNGITPLGGLLACLMPTRGREILQKYNVEKVAPLERLIAEIVSVEIPFNNRVISPDCA